MYSFSLLYITTPCHKFSIQYGTLRYFRKNNRWSRTTERWRFDTQITNYGNICSGVTLYEFCYFVIIVFLLKNIDLPFLVSVLDHAYHVIILCHTTHLFSLYQSCNIMVFLMIIILINDQTCHYMNKLKARRSHPTRTLMWWHRHHIYNTLPITETQTWCEGWQISYRKSRFRAIPPNTLIYLVKWCEMVSKQQTKIRLTHFFMILFVIHSQHNVYFLIILNQIAAGGWWDP